MRDRELVAPQAQLPCSKLVYELNITRENGYAAFTVKGESHMVWPYDACYLISATLTACKPTHCKFTGSHKMLGLCWSTLSTALAPQRAGSAHKLVPNLGDYFLPFKKLGGTLSASPEVQQLHVFVAKHHPQL